MKSEARPTAGPALCGLILANSVVIPEEVMVTLLYLVIFTDSAECHLLRTRPKGTGVCIEAQARPTAGCA